MKLRQRILLAIGATMIALIVGIFTLSHNLLLASYTQLEKRESERNVDRVVDAIHGQADDMHQMAMDWSNWDETYEFVADKNQRFIDENLATVTVKLDMMLFLDGKGKVVYSRPVDRTPGVPPPTAENVRRAIGLGDTDTIWEPTRQTKGLALIGGKLAQVSIRPVVPSDDNKPPRGWMVWVLYLDGASVDNLARRTHIDFGVHALGDQEMARDAKLRVQDLILGKGVLSKPLDRDQVAGYGLLADHSGKPIGLARVTERRLIYAQGLSSANQLIACIVLAALFFGLVSVWVLDRFALSRISSLNSQVNQMAARGDWQSRIKLAGSDELTHLARNIDNMVANLRDGREELKQNYDQLQDTVGKLASANSVLEHAVEGIARMDSSGRIITNNVSFASLLGYQRSDLCRKMWESFIHGADQELFWGALESAKDTGKETVEVQAIRADQTLFHAEISIVRSGPAEGYHLFMKDITERKWLETKIEHQAFHDALTGLPNRAKFLDRLDHALSRAKRRQSGVAVIFMDLDNFKIINDSLGHQTGDELLIQIAGRLQEFIREEDTIARLGGDEFTILLQDLHSVEEAVEVTERLVKSLAQPIQLSHGETVAMASIGIAFSDQGRDTAESLLRDADTAMYAAKARGKSGFAVFDQSMNRQVVERMELESGMRQALDLGGFHLEYQPIVSLVSGDITGIEALLRWDHPTRGSIPPDKFIPVAEDSGLIVPIGTWVLNEACRKYLELVRTMPECAPLTLSVNLSGRQLQRPDIVRQISDALKETGFNPRLLKLEVTESVLIRDEVESVGKLHELKALGIQIAIDDFGTGYSSLSTLNSYPVDVVKIDRTFISRMGQEDEVDAIVGAIVLLSRVMHLEVTAEGLETREQVQYLQAFGCDSAQGFYFSKPLAYDSLLAMLRNGLNLSIKLEQPSIDRINPILAA